MFIFALAIVQNNYNFGIMELKFIYLVISSLGITCCESLDIAKDVLASELSFDESASIRKKLLFTKKVY